MTLSIHPEAVAHYEALRPSAAGTATVPSAGRSLLQRGGMATWAHTCSACSARSGPAVMRRPPLVKSRQDSSCASPSPLTLPDPVRHQVTLLLASMVAHHRPGGNHEPACPSDPTAAESATPA